MVYLESEKVYALFEGSTLWYPATVLSGPDKNNNYQVEFSNGVVNSVDQTNVKKESSFRSGSKSPGRGRPPSTGRNRSRSRSRSPARTQRGRSPARTQRGRSKSPVVVVESRRRASPAREVTTVTETSVTRETITLEKKEPTTPTRASRRKEEPKLNHHQQHETPTRHSARLAAQTNEHPERLEPEKLLEARKVNKTRHYELGGPIGVAITAVLSTIFVVCIARHCTKKDCTLFKLPSMPKTLGSVFDKDAACLFLCGLAFQIVLSLLPTGPVKYGAQTATGHRLKYRCNGLVTLILSIGAWLLAAFYFKYPVTVFYDKYFPLVMTALIFSFLLATVSYILARQAKNGSLNPAGNSGNVIYDWFLGHELNPRVGAFDLKFFLIRLSILTMTSCNAAVLAKHCVVHKAAPSNTLLLITGMQLFFAIDFFWFEEALLYMIDIQKEGMGYMHALTFLVAGPVSMSVFPRFVIQQSVNLSNWALFAIFMLHCIGYIIKRGAASQKFQFRKNPYSPFLSHLDSIPTSAGKRLLVSGWWGLVRHPNYLGELICIFSFALTCGITHAFPYVIVLLYLLYTITLRAGRDEARCRKTYGNAWINYCKSVPCRLIPRIF